MRKRKCRENNLKGKRNCTREKEHKVMLKRKKTEIYTIRERKEKKEASEIKRFSCFVYWHINLRELVNAKDIFVEE